MEPRSWLCERDNRNQVSPTAEPDIRLRSVCITQVSSRFSLTVFRGPDEVRFLVTDSRTGTGGRELHTGFLSRKELDDILSCEDMVDSVSKCLATFKDYDYRSRRYLLSRHSSYTVIERLAGDRR